HRGEAASSLRAFLPDPEKPDAARLSAAISHWRALSPDPARPYDAVSALSDGNRPPEKDLGPIPAVQLSDWGHLLSGHGGSKLFDPHPDGEFFPSTTVDGRTVLLLLSQLAPAVYFLA